MALGGAGRSSLANDVVPGGIAPGGRDPDRVGQAQEVRRASQDGAVPFDPEDDLVPLLDTQGVAHSLRNGHLPLGGDPRRSIHHASLHLPIRYGKCDSGGARLDGAQLGPTAVPYRWTRTALREIIGARPSPTTTTDRCRCQSRGWFR